MKRYRLDAMFKGWFVGAFDPRAVWSEAVEVGIKSYIAGDREERHHHRIATEITVVLAGCAVMNNSELSDGDIVVIEPNVAVDFYAVTNVTTVVVKLPSAPGDKYPGEPA